MAWVMPKLSVFKKFYLELKIFVNKELFLLFPPWSPNNLRSTNYTSLPKLTIMKYFWRTKSKSLSKQKQVANSGAYCQLFSLIILMV